MWINAILRGLSFDTSNIKMSSTTVSPSSSSSSNNNNHTGLSAYEIARLKNIKSNKKKLASLGLSKTSIKKDLEEQQKKKQKIAAAKRLERKRKKLSKDVNNINNLTEKPTLRSTRNNLSKNVNNNSSQNSILTGLVPGLPAAGAPAKKKRKKKKRYTESELNGWHFVQTFVADNVPEDWDFEEKQMFGFAMFMVRGNMFLGFGNNSSSYGENLLVRVGEDAVISTLADSPVGVQRCIMKSGRAFPGTLMIESSQFNSMSKLRHWFNLAMAYNRTMKAKASSEKPRRRRSREYG